MVHILYISMITPYKEIANAGGKTFYHYLLSISKDRDTEVSVICKKALDDRIPGEDLKDVNFYYVTNPSEYGLKDIGVLLRDLNAKVNPFCKYGNTLRWSIYEQILNICESVKKHPDVVVLEFTQMVFLAPQIREVFPNSRIVASEHDVTFLGLRRIYENEKSWIKKAYKKIQYKVVKKYELHALEYCDIIMPHNIKDLKLLINNGVDESKLWALTPYYMQKKYDKRVQKSNKVIFYGAMSRYVNEEAAIWFIENVMPKIKTQNIIFVVLGANPSERLLKYRSDNVEITGFVENPDNYLRNCMCAVIPLHFGAGIKVKVLECFSAGIPVLTGEIGIEGIPAIDKKDYIHCETVEDYCLAINELITGKFDVTNMIINEERLIKKYFDLETSTQKYIEYVKNGLSYMDGTNDENKG